MIRVLVVETCSKEKNILKSFVKIRIISSTGQGNWRDPIEWTMVLITLFLSVDRLPLPVGAIEKQIIRSVWNNSFFWCTCVSSFSCMLVWQGCWIFFMNILFLCYWIQKSPWMQPSNRTVDECLALVGQTGAQVCSVRGGGSGKQGRAGGQTKAIWRSRGGRPAPPAKYIMQSMQSSNILLILHTSDYNQPSARRT